MIDQRRKPLNSDQLANQAIRIASLLLLILVLLTTLLKHLPPVIDAAKEVGTSIRRAAGDIEKNETKQ